MPYEHLHPYSCIQFGFDICIFPKNSCTPYCFPCKPRHDSHEQFFTLGAAINNFYFDTSQNT